MKKIQVSQLTEVQSTLLMPLWARAMEHHRANPLLTDRKAVEIVESLDFDFDTFVRKGVPQADYCIRARVLDELVRDFIEQHPSGTVIEFGVGLDTRFDRLDNGTVTWIELDLPHVIELRERFFESSDRRHLLGGSLLESHWVTLIAPLIKGPTLFVAEGVLYFLSFAQVKELLGHLVSQFPKSTFLFDAQSPLFLWFSNLRQPVKNAQMQFSVGNVRELHHMNSQSHVHRWIGFGDAPYYDQCLQRVGRVKRWGRRLFPPVRGMFKIIELRW